MSRANVSASVLGLVLVACTAHLHAESLEVLVAKKRLAMAAEIDKAIAPQQTAQAPVVAQPTGQVQHDEEPRVDAIYGVNGRVTVDVGFGVGPAFPMTKGREIKSWTILRVRSSEVVFKNVRTGRVKSVYLGEPTGSASAPTQAMSPPGQMQVAAPSIPIAVPRSAVGQ